VCFPVTEQLTIKNFLPGKKYKIITESFVKSIGELIVIFRLDIKTDSTAGIYAINLLNLPDGDV